MLATDIQFNRAGWFPRKRKKFVEWAKSSYFLSPESAAVDVKTKWRPYPFQIGVMEALGDPNIWRVVWMKSSRVGATKILNAFVGYHIDDDPASIMVIQPTQEDAKGYSKEEIATMIRDCPDVGRHFRSVGRKSRVSDETILSKFFPGGKLTIVGSNIGRNFRRSSQRVLTADEVDAYAKSAGIDGDPLLAAIMRTQHYENRKIYECSTPLVEGDSRIKLDFLAGDQRHYLVPCLKCGSFARLGRKDARIGDESADAHLFEFDPSNTDDAHFVCFSCCRRIDHADKFEMVANGNWKAFSTSRGWASFHIWAAYSFAPNASWATIAEEHVLCEKAGAEHLRTHFNTVYGDTWIIKGDAPDWEALMNRRENYPIGTAPAGVDYITIGCDVQGDRIYYEVVGWSRTTSESWSIEAMSIEGDTTHPRTFEPLSALINREFPHETQGTMVPKLLAIDGNYRKNMVYEWALKHPRKAMVVRGDSKNPYVLLGKPSKIDVTFAGKNTGATLWGVGPDIAKEDFYTRLGRDPGEQGSCHFPEYTQEIFQQFTSEHTVEERDKNGFARKVWQVIVGRENHLLDCRSYARAAAARLGFGRVVRAAVTQPTEAAPVHAPTAEAAPSPVPVTQRTEQQAAKPWSRREYTW